MSSMEGEFSGGCRDLHTVRAKTMRRGEQEVSATGGLGASEPGERGGEWAREDRPCEG